MPNIGHVIIVTGTLMLTVGCGKRASGNYAVPDANSTTVDNTEVDALWEQRGDKEALVQALAIYEAAYEANPRDRHVATRLVRGWYFMGDAHTDDDEGKSIAWDTAVNWGKACLAINDDFVAQLNEGVSEADAAQTLTIEDAPCMYWMATSLGKWARMEGLATLIKHKATVYAFISRISELDPNFFFAATDRYWGAYYAALPSFAGQDLDKSAEYFDKSIAAAPNNLSTRVLKASYWAVKTQNKAEFTALLTSVLEADPNAEPALVPENLNEQAKAQALLNQIDDLFAD